MTKYLGFQYSDLSGDVRPCSCFVKHQTSSRQHWPANSYDLNPVDYQIRGSCRCVCNAAGLMTLSS